MMDIESRSIAIFLSSTFDDIGESVKHCRPYFIGLLGKRYGWIPDKEITKTIKLNQNYGSKTMNKGFPIRISVLNYDESKKSNLVSVIEAIHVKLPYTLLVLDATVPEVEDEWNFKIRRYDGRHSKRLKTDFVIDLDGDYEFELEEYVSLMNTFNDLCHTSDIGDDELIKASKDF